jgi:O-antigen/teichoic acid export membrane protein
VNKVDLKNSIWNLLGGTLPIVIGLFTIPLLMKNIGIERFGILSLIWILIGYISIFDLGIGRALTIEISKANDSKEFDYSVLNHGFKFTFWSGIFGGVLILVLSLYIDYTWVNANKNLNSEIIYSLRIIGFTLPFVTFTSGIKGIMEGFEDFKLLNIIRMFLGILNFIIPLFVSYFIGPNLSNITLSLGIVRGLTFFVHLIALVKYNLNLDLLFQIKKFEKKSKKLLEFSFWMTLSNIVSPLMVNSDRFFIAHLLGAKYVAFYTVPFDIAIRFLIIPAAYSTTLFPSFAKRTSINEANEKHFYNQSLRIMIKISFSISILLILCSYYGLKLWIDQTFASKSWLILVIISFGIFFNSLAQVPYTYLQSQGYVKHTAILHIFEFLFYIASLFLLANFLGLYGVAICFVLRVFIDFIVLSKMKNNILGR